jgi:uncharacterized protein YutE (UPF0331/DUF86 family)
MVDKNIIASRIEAIEKHQGRLGVYMQKPRQEFLSDLNAQDIVEYNLFQIVNHLIDMIQHIVVDESIGFPESAYDGVELLHGRGIFSDRDCEVLKKMIGLRNIIGHDYIKVNKQTVYDILINGREDIHSILSAITKNFFETANR